MTLKMVFVLIIAMLLLVGCDDEKVKLADGTVVNVADIPEGYDLESIQRATWDEILAAEVRLAQKSGSIDLVPYGRSAAAVVLLGLSAWWKIKPEKNALLEIYEGIEKSNSNSPATLAALSSTMSPKSKAIIERLRLKAAIAAKNAEIKAMKTNGK